MKCCSCHQGKGKNSSPCFIIDGASSGIVAFLAVLVHPHTMQNQTLFFSLLTLSPHGITYQALRSYPHSKQNGGPGKQAILTLSAQPKNPY